MTSNGCVGSSPTWSTNGEFMVYEGYKVYAPYQSKRDGRLRVVLVRDNKKKTVSYPKFLMERKLGRYLRNNETIDHIDGNFLNNDFSNLQILDRNVHASLDVLRNKNIIVQCKCCGKKFTVLGSKIKDANSRNTGYFCSKRCVGLYGSMIRNRKVKSQFVDSNAVEKYKQKYKC